jgi:hypothetical protein
MTADQPDFWVDTERMLANKAGARAMGLAIDLIMTMWLPTRGAFRYDEQQLAEHFARVLPARGYTARKLRGYRKAVATFFTALPDGSWAPSPEYFSVTDGNAERFARENLN